MNAKLNTEELTPSDRKLLADWVSDFPRIVESRIQRMTPSEWATEKRILPDGLTDLPGPFDWTVTPYLKEIIDCFMPSSPVQRVAVMKGAQLGFSVGILENLIGWIIDCEPGPTLFVSADKEMAESVVETRVDRMIETAGIGKKIFAQVEKSHGRKTGDTKKKKEFPGGFLLPVGPNVPGKLRGYSIKTILFDEVDGYPLEVGGEGDPIKLAERRTDAFSRNKKILYISTPTLDDTSKIKQLFLQGDQSYWQVPCKKCGYFQVLKWNQLKYETDDHGLIFDTDEKQQPIKGSGHVWYECEECADRWNNDDKVSFLGLGRWVPTTRPSEPGFRSFHLSSLYSPIGFRPWESIVMEWLQIKNNPSGLRVFVNTVWGETWQERGEAPQHERIMLRREEYDPGTLPAYADALVLTLGADVQADRIECEIVAWAEKQESWSVGYYVLEGDTSNLQGKAWQGLNVLLGQNHVGMPITLALIDAGYRSTTVYQFCEQFSGGVFPCMGDPTSASGRKIFSFRDVPGYATSRVDIQTGILKGELYGYLQRERNNEEQDFPEGYCHFPLSYGEKHFLGLTAEKRVEVKFRNGSKKHEWKQIRNRNEQLDCRVYAMAALYALNSLVQTDVSPNDSISWDTFWKLVRGSGVKS